MITVGIQNKIISKSSVPSQWGVLRMPITNDMYLNLIYLSATMLPQKEDVLKL